MSQMRAKRSHVSNRADHMPAEGAAVLSGLPPRDVFPPSPPNCSSPEVVRHFQHLYNVVWLPGLFSYS